MYVCLPVDPAHAVFAKSAQRLIFVDRMHANRTGSSMKTSGSGRDRVGLRLYTLGSGIFGPVCLFSKISLSLRLLLKYPGPQA
jgi:hypothetical protein